MCVCMCMCIKLKKNNCFKHRKTKKKRSRYIEVGVAHRLINQIVSEMCHYSFEIRECSKSDGWLFLMAFEFRMQSELIYIYIYICLFNLLLDSFGRIVGS